jgi:hypothetical protein
LSGIVGDDGDALDAFGRDLPRHLVGRQGALRACWPPVIATASL